MLWDSHPDSPKYNFDKSIEKYGKWKWQSGIIRRIFHLRQIISEVNPTYVHAHSSVAGFYVRLFTYGREKIYSPHCFSFDRLDISKVKRLAYFLVEYLLHFLTSSYVANWPIEVIEISKFKPQKKISLFRPLSTLSDQNESPLLMKKYEVPCFIGVGRIRPQKDPELFANVAIAYNKITKGKFIWIGEGDEALKNKLINSGVVVVPWVETPQLAEYYRRATATLITSRWESGPLTMFESFKYSTPIVIRGSKSSNSFGLQSFDSAIEIVNQCIKLTDWNYNQDLVKTQQANCETAYYNLIKSLS